MSEQDGLYIVRDRSGRLGIQSFDSRCGGWYFIGTQRPWQDPLGEIICGPLDLEKIASGAGLNADLLEALKQITTKPDYSNPEEMVRVARAAIFMATREE